ncbi:hypothetical protein BDN70DRAFT_869771 [Pholiota conissans]|uniref:Pentatricopeptide repeat-containing protein n=1 Tax=Pholiota conissans TaxID=109636 RepID=A0A9P5ZF45_9AGAR|nr:hypothetical protein BDN70DRAFT_869771 [Pholiota conissans]
MNVVTRAIRQSAVVRGLLRPEARHLVLSSVASASTPCRAYATPSTTTPASNRLDQLVQALKSSEDVSSIHHSYTILAAEARKANGVPSTLTSSGDQDSILPVLQSLAESGKPDDIRVIEQIISDLYPLLNIAPSKNLYTSILQFLVDGGHVRQAHNFLLKIPDLSAQITPDLDQVHIVLDSCNDLPTFNSLVGYMRSMKMVPTSQTFSTIFHVRSRLAKLQKETPSIKEISALISGCVRQGLTYDPAVVDMIYDIFAASGRYSQASAILDIYQSILNSQKSKTDGDSSNGDKDERTFAELPIQPRHIPEAQEYFPMTYADVQTMLTQQSCRSPKATYSLALTNSLTSGRIEDAIQIYAEAIKAGIKPLESLLSPFLKVLTRDSSSEEYFDKAIATTRQLADTVVPIPSGSSQPLPGRPYGPGLSIYHGLIRALCDAPNTDSYTTIINELLDEMKVRGLPTNTSSHASAKVILDLRRTRDFVKTEDVYHQYRPLLNEYGYLAILKEYCRIAFSGDLEVPIVTEFFSIVQDMRLAKVPITNAVYNTFLHAVGVTGTRIKHTGQLKRLIDSTRRVHDFLTLDASITPDATLWNQLMNTYQRLGCFAEACRLWEVMYLTGRFDQISINIMLDACGFMGNLRVARSMLTKLEKARINLDLRNWNTWVECLCRTGRFEEAIDVVLVKIRQNGYEPDLQSVRVLLKFARKLPMQGANVVRARVEEGLPNLWRRLPQELKNP